MSDTTSRPTGPAARPLSPHLQVYRMMLTMVMSGMHRITGTGLYVGTLLLAWWLIAASMDSRTFAWAAWFLGSWLGQLILFGYTWALMTHLLGGLRHFIWDAGYGMEHPQREYLAQMSLVGGIGLTILIWIVSFVVR